MKNAVVGLVILACLSACAEKNPLVLDNAAPPPSRAIAAPVAVKGFQPNAFECLKEAIYFEAKPNHPTGQRAVADVIFNRKEDPRFPNTVCDVIAEGEDIGRCQFSYRCDGRAEVYPDEVKLKSSVRAAKEALANPSADITEGAVFFHAVRMPPGWFGTLDRTAEYGGHFFYRG